MEIQKLSTLLNIRVRRLKDKAQTLDIVVPKNGTLSQSDSIKLVQSYLLSKKTSDETKQRATQFLNQLNGTQNILAPPPKVQSAVAKRKKYRHKKLYHIGIQLIIDFIIAIYRPIQQLAKSILTGCVQLLESVQFKFIALVVAICVQMHHSAHWFYRVSNDDPNWYTAYGYAFMVDLFILVITMEGKLSIAKTFAWLTFLANVLYFQFWVNFDGTRQAFTNALSSLLISAIMAYIIYAYTELFVKYRTIN